LGFGYTTKKEAYLQSSDHHIKSFPRSHLHCKHIIGCRYGQETRKIIHLQHPLNCQFTNSWWHWTRLWSLIPSLSTLIKHLTAMWHF